MLLVQAREVYPLAIARTVPKVLDKVLPKTKKNTPPLTGGARDGGYFNAPESNQPEFEYIDPATLPEFQRPTSPSSGFYVDEFSQWLAREDSRRLAKEYASRESIWKLYKQWTESPSYEQYKESAEEARTRRGYRFIPAVTPTSKPDVDVPRTPVTGQPDRGFDVPETTLEEPEFGIPDEPPEDDEKDREEEFEECQELTEKIRIVTGVTIPFCQQGGDSESGYILGTTDEWRNKAVHMVRSKRKSPRRRRR